MLKASTSILDSFLFNPTTRVYNLRLLILVTVALIPIMVVFRAVPAWYNDGYAVFYDADEPILSIVSSSAVLVQQVGRLLLKRGLRAVYDWCLNLAVICVVAYIVGFSNDIYRYIAGGVNIVLIGHAIQLAALVVSQVWCTATIMQSPEKIMKQRFDFLGGCRKSEYRTWATILFNRSANRPLVRGEYPATAIVRALVLSTLCLLLPAIAVYIIVLAPLNAQVFTRQIPPTPQQIQPTSSMFAQMLDTNLLKVFASDDQEVSLNESPCANATYRIEVTKEGNVSVAEPCPRGFWACHGPKLFTLYLTPKSQENVSYIQVGQGEYEDVLHYVDQIAIFHGVHISATLTWTQLQVIPHGLPSLMGPLAPLRTVFVGELHTIQPDPRYNGKSDLQNSTLLIYQPEFSPTKFIQEYTESSAVGGLATVGGLWTFINGAFALFFGANIIYFLFGRRPLSALGIVHIFQRRRLVRQWHEDFPALYTEGGMPGSQTAGIVAFLRERLVDLEEVDDTAHPMDQEGQNDLPPTPCHGISSIHTDDSPELNRMSGSEDTMSVSSDSVSGSTCSLYNCECKLDDISLMDGPKDKRIRRPSCDGQ